MFLTVKEIDDICEGLGANSQAAKCKRLASMGLIVNRKPKGRPLVVRSHAEAVLSSRAALEHEVLPPASCPAAGDRAAVIALFGRKAACRRLRTRRFKLNLVASKSLGGFLHRRASFGRQRWAKSRRRDRLFHVDEREHLASSPSA